ncbi:MAG: ATP-binding protein, partial [Bacteroidota bacterium]
REKLVTSFAILSVLPLLVLAYYNRELAVDRLNETIGRRLSQELDLVEQRITTAVLDEEDFLSGINDDFCEVVATDLGIDFTVYGRMSLQASSRPELYKASMLDERLHGPAFANAVLLGKKFYQASEQIGTVRYIVGYRPLYLGERFLGVIAVPALYRLQEIDEELAQRNAFLLGAYAVVVLIIIVIAVALANRLSKPLRELSAAAQRVGRGELDVRIPRRSSDEVGELVDSFNEMTDELKSNREHLVRAERELAWKEMAKQVAHEIKNPLTPMKLSMQHLVQAYRDGVSNFGEVLDRVARTMVDQVEALSRIASEFSNFARMPVRKFERVDVNDLLRETVALFAGVRGVEFRTDYSEVPLPLVADKDELRRALINIIRNSVQAMDQEGIVAIESSVHGGTCRIRIRDNGPGIPEEIQAKVFQPNFSTKTDGMGFGLAITRKVIEDLDGAITLRSTVGEGTVIEIMLPVKPQ